MLKKGLILILAWITGLTAEAQSGESSMYYAAPIKIDKATKKTSSPIPFDKSFVLEYGLEKGEQIDKIYIYEVELERENGEISRNIIMQKTDSGKQAAPTPYLHKFDTLNNTLYIEIKNLPPNRLIDIVVLKRLSEKEIKNLLEINILLYKYFLTKDETFSLAANKLYADFIKTISKNLYSGQRNFSKLSFTGYLNFYRDTLLPKYQTILSHNYDPGLSSKVDIQKIRNINALFSQLGLSNQELTILFQAAGNDIIDDVFTGNREIKSPSYGDPAKIEEFDKRIANLDSSLATLRKLNFTVDKAYMISNDQDIQKFSSLLLDVRSTLNQNKTIIKENKNEIQKLVRNTDLLYKEEWILTGNDFNNLEQKSKFIIVPDIGLANIFILGNDRLFYYPRPFLGTNIYFRPVDKTLREKHLPKTDILRIMSLQIGLTYGEFDNSEFSNLFNDFSILIGPSFKINRSFRISPGWTLLQKEQENPMVTKKRVYVGYYLAFSFDLDIASNSPLSRARVIK